MRIMIAAGGTGGHIYPGIAIAEELKGNEILFIGSREGLEGDIIRREGFRIILIHARGLLRKISYKAISAPFMTIIGFFEALGALFSFKPKMLVVTGGYVSFPVIAAAIILRIPFLLHEENVLPGVTNRFWHKYAKIVTLSFAETTRYMNGIVTGNPVRKKILGLKKVSGQRKTVTIIGGSQGARSINKALISQIESLKDFEIYHIIGNRDFNLMELPRLTFYHPLAYVYNMDELFAKSDLVVSRAGATAISEILACGLPSILIPFPYSAEGHQDLNAAILRDAGAAEVLPDKEAFRLPEMINSILSNDKKMKEMGNSAAKMAKRNAGRKIVDLIYAVS